MSKRNAGSPFLLSDDGLKIVGVLNPDNTEGGAVPRVYTSLSDRPSAVNFGVGSCLVAGIPYVSDGSAWYPIRTSAVAGQTGLNIAVAESRDAALTDNGNVLICATAVAITIENDATTGWEEAAAFTIYSAGATPAEFAAGTDVTIRNPGTLTGAQYGILNILRIGVNEWTIWG
jgi:hypothetical protein